MHPYGDERWEGGDGWCLEGRLTGSGRQFCWPSAGGLSPMAADLAGPRPPGAGRASGLAPTAGTSGDSCPASCFWSDVGAVAGASVADAGREHAVHRTIAISRTAEAAATARTNSGSIPTASASAHKYTSISAENRLAWRTASPMGRTAPAATGAGSSWSPVRHGPRLARARPAASASGVETWTEVGSALCVMAAGLTTLATPV